MNLPRLLLLSGVVPGTGNVGRVYLRAICKLYPPDRIAAFSLEEPTPRRRGPDLDWLPVEHRPAPPERGCGWPGERGWGVVRHAAERWIERTRIPPLVDDVVRFARSRGIDRLWVPLHSPTTVRLARPVAARLGVPLLTTVWDPPAYKLGQFALDRPTRRRLLREFDEALQSSLACCVASDAMKHAFEARHGTRCVTMILGAPRGADRPPATPATDSDPGRPFRIGFAGTLYARREWSALVETLDRSSWKIGGRKVIISLFGDHDDIARALPGKVECRGWLDPGETVERMAAFDAAYLPYWFDPHYREVVELAFPGKLATYAAARVPVLFHGPRHSSPARFLNRYPLGICCHSLETEELAATLERLVTDSALRDAARQAADTAYEKELAETVFRERLAELLEIPTNRLLPLTTPQPTTP